MAEIVVVDYGMGNLRSVSKAFESQGGRVAVSSAPEDVARAAKIVLPGVGAFTSAVRELDRRGLTDTLIAKIRSGTPYLGLCLGLQLLFDGSEESQGKGQAKGFGIIAGRVKKFSARGGPAFGGRPLKVPHMGWNTLTIKKKGCPLTAGVGKDDAFYFVHSFYGEPKDKSWVLATTDYGRPFCSAVWKDHIFATQFHPEKSQAAGLALIRNFVEL